MSGRDRQAEWRARQLAGEIKASHAALGAAFGNLCTGDNSVIEERGMDEAELTEADCNRRELRCPTVGDIARMAAVQRRVRPMDEWQVEIDSEACDVAHTECMHRVVNERLFARQLSEEHGSSKRPALAAGHQIAPPYALVDKHRGVQKAGDGSPVDLERYGQVGSERRGGQCNSDDDSQYRQQILRAFDLHETGLSSACPFDNGR